MPRTKRRVKRPKPMLIGFNKLNIDQKRKVLYRNFHEISGRVYLTEISRNNYKVFIVLFEHYTEPNDFIAEVLSEKVALKLMADCANSFENFIGNFHIKFGKLQILGYHNKGTSVRTSAQKLEPILRESKVDFNFNVTPMSVRKTTGNIDVTDFDEVKDQANKTMPCLGL